MGAIFHSLAAVYYSMLLTHVIQHFTTLRHTVYTCFNRICKSIEYGLLLHAYANVGHSLVLVAHVRFVLANEGPLS